METLFDLFQSFKHRKKTAIVYRTGIRRFVFPYSDVYSLSLKMAAFLKEKGVKKGDCVILWAPNSPWWAVAFWGIVANGAVVVPVDFASGKERAETIAKLAKAKLIIQSQYKLDKLSTGLLIEDLQYLLEKIGPINTLVKPKPDDIVELVYTSGTTGNPKGVMLTHKNLMASMIQVDKHIALTPSYNLLSVLPLSHMFEQMIGFLVPLYKGATIVYLRTFKPSALMEALKEEDIYVIVAVPRLLLLLKHSVEREFRQKRLEKILKIFLAWASGKSHTLKKLLFAPVHKKFGKHFQFFVSGGSALDPTVGKFWQDLGFTVIEGYGLTECAPVLTANARDKQVLGSVGKPLADIKIKIRGREILAKGANIFSGYWQNERATKEAFTKDGWFRTGDEGEMDSKGNLYIKGRRKELIVTSAGVNVYPDEVEYVLNYIPGVRESCVMGLDQGGGEEVHAVLLLEPGSPPPEIIIQKANEKLDPQQQITGFTIWPEAEFPKTQTLKIQKFRVKEHLTKGVKEEKGITGDKLIELVSRVSGKPISEIKERSVLLLDLGITSVGRLELTNYIEQEYRLDIEDTTINQHTTVGDLRRIIQQRENHDIPLRLSFYPNKPWARFLRETTHALVHRRLFGHFIQLSEVKRVEQFQNLRMPVVLITNHISYLDYVPVAMALPKVWRERTATAAREEFFFGGGALSRIGKRILLEYSTFMGNVFLLPQKRGFRKSLAFMGKLADNGVNILLFPEGERSWDEKLLPFQAGLGIIVKELQVPVLPVRVYGMEKILPRGTLSLKRGKVKVIFGKPLFFTTETPSEIVGKCREAMLIL